MEPNRFQHNQVLYLVGMVCLFLSLLLFGLGFYSLPYLVFGWRYNVPDFITLWTASVQDEYNLTQSGGAWIILFMIFFPAIISAFVAYVLSNRIDSTLQTNTINKEIPKKKKSESEQSDRLIIKIIVIILMVFVASEFFQWSISTTPKL